MNERTLISIFWTGGWDSSYRVVELSRMEIDIQPIYILDEKRAGHTYELKAIEKMTTLLRRKIETKATFREIKIIKVSDIKENEHITNTIKKLMKENGIGIQHDWTARVALDYPGVEMCIEKAIKGYMPIRETVNRYGKLKMGSHGYEVDYEASSDELRSVLGNIVLPIFEITETEMKKNIEEWGYEDVMANIWFCHRPINGKPCGLCSPCHTKYDSNMSWLLPESAIKECERVKRVEKLGKIPTKLYRVIKRKILEMR